MLPAFTPILAEITWPVLLLAAGFVIISLFMMLVILIQKPKGGGLSGAFGGAGGGESSFVGAKVGDFLTYLTVGCFVAFLLLAMALTWKINPTENQAKAAAALQQQQQTTGTAGGSAGDGSADTTEQGDATPDADPSEPSGVEPAAEIDSEQAMLEAGEAIQDAAETAADETPPAPTE